MMCLDHLMETITDDNDAVGAIYLNKRSVYQAQDA